MKTIKEFETLKQMKNAIDEYLGSNLVNPELKKSYRKFYDTCYKQLDSALEELSQYKQLEEQIGCPLEVVGKLRKANHIYRDDGLAFGFIGINFNDEDKLILYNDDECNIFTSDLRLTDHKKTWWLKEDKSE